MAKEGLEFKGYVSSKIVLKGVDKKGYVPPEPPPPPKKSQSTKPISQKGLEFKAGYVPPKIVLKVDDIKGYVPPETPPKPQDSQASKPQSTEPVSPDKQKE